VQTIIQGYKTRMSIIYISCYRFLNDDNFVLRNEGIMFSKDDTTNFKNQKNEAQPRIHPYSNKKTRGNTWFIPIMNE
jgi:hypothetical protein